MTKINSRKTIVKKDSTTNWSLSMFQMFETKIWEAAGLNYKIDNWRMNVDPDAARGCFLRGWHNIWLVNLGDICYLHYIVSQMYTCGFLDKIDCYWGFFLRLSISLDRFILFVIRSYCAPSSGGRPNWWCSFKWFTRKAVFVLNPNKMQKWKKLQSQEVFMQVTKYTFACKTSVT